MSVYLNAFMLLGWESPALMISVMVIFSFLKYLKLLFNKYLRSLQLILAQPLQSGVLTPRSLFLRETLSLLLSCLWRDSALRSLLR